MSLQEEQPFEDPENIPYELELVTCAEDPDLPNLVVVTDLGCMGVPIVWTPDGLVLAVPAGAGQIGEHSSGPHQVPLAEEGTWLMGDGEAEQVGVSYFKLGIESVGTGITPLDTNSIEPSELTCFVSETFLVPVSRALLETWKGIAAQQGGARTPDARRGPPQPRGRGRGRAATRARGGRGVSPTTSRSVASLAKMLDERLTKIEGRLGTVETGGGGGAAVAAASGSPTTSPTGPSLMGVAGAPPTGAGPLAEARRLLGLGDMSSASAVPVGGRLGGALAAVPPSLSASPACGAPPGLGLNSTPGPQATGVTPATPPDGQEALLQRLVLALEGRSSSGTQALELFGLGGGGASTSAEYEAGLGSFAGPGGIGRAAPGAAGLVNMERLIATRRNHPEVIIAANEVSIKQTLGTLPGETWSVSRHAAAHLLPHAGTFLTLKRMATILAAALDEGRTRGGLHQHAFLYHAYRVVEGAVNSDGHDLGWAWPLLGIEDPGGRPLGGLAPVEAAGLAAYHRDRIALDTARGVGAQRRSPGGGSGEHGDDGGGGGSAAARAKAKAAAAAARKAGEDNKKKAAAEGGGGKP
jgi:hypothetical protein